MALLACMVFVPCAAGLLLLVVPQEGARRVLVCLFGIATAALSVAAFVVWFGQGTVSFELEEGLAEAIGHAALGIEVLLCVYLAAKGVKGKEWFALALALAQLVLVVLSDLYFSSGLKAAYQLYVDTLTLVMCIIIGVVGGGICVYAIGYMSDYQKEREGEPDRRRLFFSIMFLFLSAMFVIVISNDLRWVLCGWEVTTVCSFVLIGFSQDKASVKNAFTQIKLNLVGGIAFTVAIILAAWQVGTVDLARFITSAASSSPALAGPLALLCVAGLVKAAQMPVHRWLLGAMVAPTPTSALLHSSTMVKAGVFLLIKLSPALGFDAPGYMVMLVGGCTFALAAFSAISQRNAKRVLAYSTISNLGLIAACAGTGSATGVWAAIFLLLFHALAKALLFCCVGTAEHSIGSRDIECMDLLFERMPRLARYMVLGSMIMFIAPFGMLIGKWAAFVSLLDAGNVFVVVLVCFGSAATFLFWAKWIGKLVACTGSEQSIEGRVHKSEWAYLTVELALSCLSCLAVPWISSLVMEPYAQGMFPQGFANLAGTGELGLLAVMGACVVVLLATLPNRSLKSRHDVYLSGVGVDNAGREFMSSFQAPLHSSQANMYLESVFPEASIERLSTVAGTVLLVAGVAISFILGSQYEIASLVQRAM